MASDADVISALVILGALVIVVAYFAIGEYRKGPWNDD